MNPKDTAKAKPESFFLTRNGLERSKLEHLLDNAVGNRADYGDLFFESRVTESLSLEDSMVKQAQRSVAQGVGVRIVSGAKAGYAYSDELSLATLQDAAETARHIADDRSDTPPTLVAGASESRDLYSLENAPVATPHTEMVRLLSEIDVLARASDSRIQNVMASLVAEHRRVLIVGSDGSFVSDERPLLRLNVSCIAGNGHDRQQGSAGGGGRVEWSYLLESESGESVPRYRFWLEDAVRQALLNLEAEAAPAGSQTVVLGPGWPGILLHEAIGHGLEADFNRKGLSAFAGRIGDSVASELCTVVDDGTIPNRRGSLNVDDEGTPSQRTTLIEKGRLRGYLQDRQNAQLMGSLPTGNGRRESFAHLPMPRMTNTFMVGGEDDPEDILRSVPNGLYAVNFGGGQVDITNGKFVFSASEAYRIENGRIGAPVRGATLIGSGPEILQRVSRVGHDLRLDSGVGTCGKDGQSVPVGVGLPTIRIDGLTVGGTAL